MTAPWDFSDLRAVFINCTLKRSPELSHTGGLIDISRSIMDKHGVTVDVIRAVDHDIATGVWPDMTEHGWDSDEWPALYQRVLAADIGRALGCGAYLSALRRTAVGAFRVAEAVPLDELERSGAGPGRQRLLPVDALVRSLQPFAAGLEEAAHFRHGRVIPVAAAGPDPVAVYAPGGRFLGVAEPAPGGGLAPLRLMAERDEIP